jgi:hypothetical protein
MGNKPVVELTTRPHRTAHAAPAAAAPCVAIVGSRDFADLDRVRRFVHELPADVTVLSGGARGVDRCAASTARARGLRTEELLANWDRDGRFLAGRIRNERLARRCDRMFAFWDGRSTGTQDAFHRALRLRRHVVLYRLRMTALVGTLTGRPLLLTSGGPLRAELDLTVVSSASDGRERVKVHHVAAVGDTAEALAALPAGARVRLQATLRQIFVSNAEWRLEGRPGRVEARSFKLLSRKGRKR